MLALAGDITITAKKVDILEARETSHNQTETKLKQSGLTVAVTSPVITAIQTAQQMSQAASDTRMCDLCSSTDECRLLGTTSLATTATLGRVQPKATNLPVTPASLQKPFIRIERRSRDIPKRQHQPKRNRPSSRIDNQTPVVKA